MSAVEDLGSAIKRLREAKGMTQEDVIDQIPDLYSERSLRRVENGQRKQPTRDRLLRLLAKGLLEHDATKIDAILKLAGYEGATDQEIESYGLIRLDPRVSTEPPKHEPSPHPVEHSEVS